MFLFVYTFMDENEVLRYGSTVLSNEHTIRSFEDVELIEKQLRGQRDKPTLEYHWVQDLPNDWPRNTDQPYAYVVSFRAWTPHELFQSSIELVLEYPIIDEESLRQAEDLDLIRQIPVRFPDLPDCTGAIILNLKPMNFPSAGSRV